MNDERQPSILIVDDEIAVGQNIARILGKLSDDVTYVPSGSEAVKLCQQRAFDLVISDMQMPGMDGVALLQLLAHDYPSMRRMVLTGHADLDKTMAAINAGRVHRYLTKPCPADELLNAVKSELETARRERVEITRLRAAIEQLSDPRDET